MQKYCLSRFHDVPPEEMTQEQRLLYKLMKSYDRATRPVYEARKPVEIKLGLSLTQVLDVVSLPKKTLTAYTLHT